MTLYTHQHRIPLGKEEKDGPSSNHYPKVPRERLQEGTDHHDCCPQQNRSLPANAFTDGVSQQRAEQATKVITADDDTLECFFPDETEALLEACDGQDSTYIYLFSRY